MRNILSLSDEENRQCQGITSFTFHFVLVPLSDAQDTAHARVYKSRLIYRLVNVSLHQML